jgi:hypothetical protein
LSLHIASSPYGTGPSLSIPRQCPVWAQMNYA